MTDYATRRLENIKRNEALVQGLGLQDGLAANYADEEEKRAKSVKRRKVQQPPQKTVVRPTRSSARIANAPSKPAYTGADSDRNDPADEFSSSDSSGSSSNDEKQHHRRAAAAGRPKGRGRGRPKTTTTALTAAAAPPPTSQPTLDIQSFRHSWTSWTPSQPPPTLDPETGTYHFASHPHFRPNKSPESIIREGCFGGTYYRTLYSSHLRATISSEDDFAADIPAEWVSGGNLDVGRYLTSSTYDPEVNKYGVKCGQSFEEWERSGWIRHEFDVRGWFQWYVRFWRGRRLPEDDGEDERQIGRWRRCVGPPDDDGGKGGRWRRALLKKYVQMGIRSVTDEDGGEREGQADVSPVVHQTCHHWAWEVRQEDLDRFWEEEG